MKTCYHILTFDRSTNKATRVRRCYRSVAAANQAADARGVGHRRIKQCRKSCSCKCAGIRGRPADRASKTLEALTNGKKQVHWPAPGRMPGSPHGYTGGTIDATRVHRKQKVSFFGRCC